MKMRQQLAYLISTAGALVLLTSCATTTAPTEASTETFGNTTDATSRLTSSTSPGESAANYAQAVRFVQKNYARVKTDMARGNGEHLETLAALLEVPAVERERFYAMAKNNFARLYPQPDTAAREMLQVLSLQMNVLLSS